MVGTEAQQNTRNGFPVEHISAPVGSVVAVIVLITFLFFMKRFWCKKENSNPDSGVSKVFCSQQLTSLIRDALGEGIRRGHLWHCLCSVLKQTELR